MERLESSHARFFTLQWSHESFGQRRNYCTWWPLNDFFILWDISRIYPLTSISITPSKSKPLIFSLGDRTPSYLIPSFQCCHPSHCLDRVAPGTSHTGRVSFPLFPSIIYWGKPEMLTTVSSLSFWLHLIPFVHLSHSHLLCFLSISRSIPYQGLCICCSLCMECLSLRFSHDWTLLILQVSAPMSSLPKVLPCSAILFK